MQGLLPMPACPKRVHMYLGLAFVITYIRKKIAECPVDPSGTLNCNLRADPGRTPHVVPDQCMATVDMRLCSSGLDTKKAEEIVREAMAEAAGSGS